MVEASAGTKDTGRARAAARRGSGGGGAEALGGTGGLSPWGVATLAGESVWSGAGTANGTGVPGADGGNGTDDGDAGRWLLSAEMSSTGVVKRSISSGGDKSGAWDSSVPLGSGVAGAVGVSWRADPAVRWRFLCGRGGGGPDAGRGIGATNGRWRGGGGGRVRGGGGGNRLGGTGGTDLFASDLTGSSLGLGLSAVLLKDLDILPQNAPIPMMERLG